MLITSCVLQGRRKAYGDLAWQRKSGRLARVVEDSSGVLSEAPVFEDQAEQFESSFEMPETSSPPPVDPELLRAVSSVVMGCPFLNQMKEIMRKLREEDHHSVNFDEEPEPPEGPKNSLPLREGEISPV